MTDSAYPDPSTSPLRSVHTKTLPPLLGELGITLLISTYQAGKLIFVRRDGDRANTHFRTFFIPMGVAFDRRQARLAIGTRLGVWEFCSHPPLAQKLEPIGKYDACFLPRHYHSTGNIAIHEMAYDSTGELWAVNTRFSCLCTFNRDASFVPRWRPYFISNLAPEDRCHLNGMALVDGRPKFVTALGTTNHAHGWRENKARGGVLLDVPSQSVIVDGLSMPHSPRWYRDQLWVLESGAGSLARVDLATGKLDIVAMLPGFTRGLDFWGDFAFVGLSQVRESALFSGIPITERLTVEQRCCGMWVVHLLNGQVVAFVRFEEGVQEIFAVEVLPLRFPELLNEPNDDNIANSFMLSEEALRQIDPSAL